ncbi:dihydroorotase [Sediminibacterium sp.]|uniref:dihydroorotase n=1 Tax=Sediminibacterium sp. TaxID=1917865 RepID=UPI003F72166F
MSVKYLIKNVAIVNEGEIQIRDVLFYDDYIQKIGLIQTQDDFLVINGTGKYLLPGVIDAQVHFREPGLSNKGDIFSESRAAAAGGVTSFIDMPNTVPNVLSNELLKQKYDIAARNSAINYGFAMGISASNMDELLASDTTQYLMITDDGLYFSGKGNILADNNDLMEHIFSRSNCLIAIHAEKEAIIEANEIKYKKEFGENIPARMHPIIRSEAACYAATKDAIDIANKYNARLHILHLSTAAETHLFRNDLPLAEKNITCEVSVHHLWFSDADYEKLGMRIKWNPAIKSMKDKNGLMKALLEDKIDMITTDHAPHLLEEKDVPYFQSKSGAPMVQHTLSCMLSFYQEGLISLEKLVEKMCHNPALIYNIAKRGFIKEGYYADLVLVDFDESWVVSKNNILYKCGWSPLEGTQFNSIIRKTFVNGHLVYDNGIVIDHICGKALSNT